MSSATKPRRQAHGALRILRRMFASTGGAVGFGLCGTMIVLGAIGPLVVSHAPQTTNFAATLLPPSLEWPLGTDDFGRDQLSRVLSGLSASIQIGVLSVLVSAAVGVPLGLLAGYYGVVDAIISRAVDVLLSFPYLILAVGLAAILGPSALNLTIALAVAALPGFVRVIRGEVLRLKGLDFVSSAIASGASDSRILFLHLLPNTASALLVQLTLSIPVAVLGEAMLSFLGLGLRPPAPSLGIMLSNSQPYIQQAWWMAVFPGVAIIILTLAFNLLGDALRDALDPRSRRS